MKRILSISSILICLSISSFGATYDAVVDFGANPSDNGGNDTTYLQNAINTVCAQGGGTLYIPEGVYEVTKLVLPSSGNQDITIKGDGDSASIIRARDSQNVIDFDFNSIDDNLIIEDITIQSRSSGNSGIAIDVSYPLYTSTTNSNHEHFGFVANRVHIDSRYNFASGTGYFTAGIKVSNAWNTRITNCIISGWKRTQANTRGIYFADSCINSLVQGCSINFVERGLDFEVSSSGNLQHEGIKVDNCEIVDVKYGLKVDSSTAGNVAFWITLTNSHVDARGSNAACVKLESASQCFIKDNLLYLSAALYGFHFLGYDVTNSQISNNVLVTDNYPLSGGFMLHSGCGHNIISNNNFINAQYAAIRLTSNTYYNHVSDNVLQPQAVLNIQDQGISNNLVDNIKF
ncbi:glycoside hydrolase family 55 protein [Puniceicoccaceae bacterium K14]|nr:glycoside hydrolase family 55 protein [Puniceicoccaceae bacterium K14]